MSYKLHLQILRDAVQGAGRHAVEYRNSAAPNSRSITLNTYRPAHATANSPIVLVQHGVLRNGDDYRDFWIPAADEHGLVIIAPTFSNEQWPDVVSYNNGNLLATTDRAALADTAAATTPDRWSYTVVTRLVDDLKTSGLLANQPLYLFGHSAGGQFVHRLMSVLTPGVFTQVAAGNPGWYTLPLLELPFPEGLGGTPANADSLARLFASPLTILAGDQDTETNDPHLPSEPAALRQGPHRHARALHYYATAKAEAARRGLPFDWQLHSIAGIGHDGQAMSAVCAHLWFHHRLPDSDQLAALAGQHMA
ncbi:MULTISPECIES: alpha/beta hydrolase [unclassified Polaromonas]|uniref:alpha/beta hydrolase n=1 Tax=unclassified Polaromonas TaxID=2638319 RepID=UPI0018CAFBD2|nr:MULTISPECIES: alpha/beta hydrolase [unclassified Polaromonas]MBG6073782.1 poly(3-hydroxybutyrate) depolymerase [Polaromonas sp. CG_9.7]MBG6115774.1 poly(3-hydroxybutyrate) depolymerase [Polaromonas sp. CG_9.2]MDH6186671.1 poly(3-hydroxybutyrate) depolymerase [Polaromonas sp. CG_23.6]